MAFENQFTNILTDDNLMETIFRNNESFPFHYYYENVGLFDFKCIDWHWHNELEFVYIESGQVSFDVGEAHLKLDAGDGIMVNSKALHRIRTRQEAVIPNFLIQPDLIAPKDSLIYEKYVAPVLSSSCEYVIFRENVPWQKEFLSIMKKIIALQETEKNREMAILLCIQQFWLLLLENMKFDQPENAVSLTSKIRVQLMMQYVHDHYPENITLEDIANEAHVSKSTARQLFQENLQTSPVNYLISYRLRRASLLLANTEEKITSISMETGFNNVDHFCRSFKKTYDMTPTEYRKRISGR